MPERAIAEIMGWDEDDVAKIIRRYVDRTAATKAIIKQIAEAKTQNIVCKTMCKTSRNGNPQNQC